MNKGKISTKKIAQTALMTALLVILQFATKSFGQIVTGSCVNFVLASTVLLCGLGSAVFVAIISPIFAFLLGIGPAFLPIVPGISAGNLVLVLILYLFLGKKEDAPAIRKISAVAVSAIGKFLVLFILVTKIIVPLLSLNEKQSAMISASFSYPQLITACIGVALAVILFPRLIKGIKK